MLGVKTKLPSVKSCLIRMKARPGDPGIQKAACQWLRQHLVKDCLELTLLHEEMTSCILNTIMMLEGKVEVVQDACKTLTLLTALSEGVCESLVELGGVHTLVRCAQYHQHHPALHENIGLILGYISALQDLIPELQNIKIPDFVCKLMKDHPKSVSIRNSCCQIITNISTTREAADAVLGAGALPLLIQSARYEGDHLLPQSACTALGTLALFDSCIKEVVRNNAMELTLKMMLAYPSDLVLQQNSCWVLSSLTRSGEAGRQFITLGGLDLLLRIMKDYPQTTFIQEYGCWTLGNLACTGDLRSALSEWNVVERLISSLSTCYDQPDIQIRVLFILSQLDTSTLRKKGGEDLGKSIRRCWQGVLLAMRSLQDNGTVQVKAFGALTSLMPLCEDLVPMEEFLTQCGETVEAVTTAMWIHNKMDNLLLAGCQTLFKICKNSSVSVTDDVIEILVEILHCFSSNEVLVQIALDLLCWITKSGIGCYSLISSGGWQAVEKQLKISFSQQNNITASCCLVLTQFVEALMKHEKPGISHSRFHSLVENVVKVMLLSPSNKAIHLRTCLMLHSLFLSKCGRKVFHEINGVVLVRHAMKTHLGEASIQECGCGLLLQLTEPENVKGDAEILDVAASLSTVLAAMTQHPDDLDIQLLGSRLITNLAAHLDSRPYLLRDSLTISKCMTSAMSSHPSSSRLQAAAQTTLKFLKSNM